MNMEAGCKLRVRILSAVSDMPLDAETAFVLVLLLVHFDIHFWMKCALFIV